MTTPTHTHASTCWWHPFEARWECPPAAPTGPPSVRPEGPLVDVRDMIVVHTALLREFRLAPAAVRRTAVGDRRQARAVADHLRFVGDMLHHHHEGEDELLWPLLRQRSPGHAQLLDDIEAQHDGLDTALNNVVQAREAWAAAPAVEQRESLADSLTVLHALLRDHLDLEERCVLPVAAAVLAPAEWTAIGARAAAAMPKPTLALAFGMFGYEGDPDVLTQMLSAAPPPARVLVPRVAPHLYARRARRIYGTARP